MLKKWLIAALLAGLIAGLYIIEISRVSTGDYADLPTLDGVRPDEASAAWEPFYRVRAVLIDGGRAATFQFPEEIKKQTGREISLEGAAVFYSPGCKIKDSQIEVRYFYLIPSIGLANACVILPDVAMRWTVRVTPEQPWIVSRDDMIDAFVTVTGTFRIDTSKPYESVFFIDNANVQLCAE